MAMTGGTSKLVSQGTPPGWPGPVSLYVYYKEKSQNTALNQTVLSLGMYVTTPSGWGIGEWSDWNGSYIGTATSGTNCKTFNGTIPNFSGTRWLVENQDITITHNGDGTKSVTIYWHWGVNSSWSGVMNNPSGSFSVNLTTIPRASTVTASNVTLGNSCSVKWTPKAASFRYKLKFSLGGWSFTTGVIHPNGTSEYNYTGYTIPLEVANQLPTAYTGTMTVVLYTYSDSAGTVPVGNDDATFTVTVPSSVKPSVTMSVSPVHSLPSVFSGLYIQGLTKVKATMSATTYYSATVSYYDMTVEGKTYGQSAAYTSDYIQGYGSISISGHAVDSRSYGGYDSATIDVIPYAGPKLQNVSAARCTADGTPNDSGAYLKIVAKRVYSPCMSGGVQKNFCQIRYRYRTANSEIWSNWATVLDAKSLASDEVSTSGLLNGEFRVSNTYVVEIQAVDDIGYTATVSVVVPTDMVYWHRDGANNALGLGKYAEEAETLDMAWNIKTNKNITAEGNCNIGGTVTAAAVETEGDIAVGGTVNAAAAVTEGNVVVGGTLNANHIGYIGYYRGLDFNTLTSQTGYYVDSGVPSSMGAKNYPVNTTGMLEVIGYNGSFAYQTYRTHDGLMYIRGYYSGSGWSTWKKVQLV